jgi:hypothetical protein
VVKYFPASPLWPLSLQSHPHHKVFLRAVEKMPPVRGRNKILTPPNSQDKDEIADDVETVAAVKIEVTEAPRRRRVSMPLVGQTNQIPSPPNSQEVNSEIEIDVQTTVKVEAAAVVKTEADNVSGAKTETPMSPPASQDNHQVATQEEPVENQNIPANEADDEEDNEDGKGESDEYYQSAKISSAFLYHYGDKHDLPHTVFLQNEATLACIRAQRAHPLGAASTHQQLPPQDPNQTFTCACKIPQPAVRKYCDAGDPLDVGKYYYVCPDRVEDARGIVVKGCWYKEWIESQEDMIRRTKIIMLIDGTRARYVRKPHQGEIRWYKCHCGIPTKRYVVEEGRMANIGRRYQSCLKDKCKFWIWADGCVTWSQRNSNWKFRWGERGIFG